jgi:hypothetical protein
MSMSAIKVWFLPAQRLRLAASQLLNFAKLQGS